MKKIAASILILSTAVSVASCAAPGKDDSSFSMLDMGYSIPVRDQGPPGACVPYSYATAMEYNIRYTLDEEFEIPPQDLIVDICGVDKEEGYIPSFNGQSLHYYYYLRLLPSPDEDNGWIDTDWGMVVHGNYLYLTLIHRRYFIIDKYVYKRSGTYDDESVIILNGNWNLMESHEGEAKAEESITFDDKGTCMRRDSLGNKISGRYSIHEEKGEMYTIHNNLLPYKYYLRLQEHIGDDDVTRDLGIFFDGARIFLTPIHERNEEGAFYIYMREDHQ